MDGERTFDGEERLVSGSIRVGGLEFEAAWVRCRAQASFKPEEAFVRLTAEDVERPLGFYVDRGLVRPGELGQQETDGEVKVVVLSRQNGSTTVQVPGEPVGYGPRITLANDQFTGGRAVL